MTKLSRENMIFFSLNIILGAGNLIEAINYKSVCKEAVQIGSTVLQHSNALDACEAAIIHLENCDKTNAGFGSNLTWDGKIECEASIMDGLTLQYGACTNVNNIKNPIKLAKMLCEKQSSLLKFGRIPPMILCGDGASEYAKAMKIPLIDMEKLISEKALNCYTHFKDKISKYQMMYDTNLSPMDTIGVVCVDGNGNCASGCSSGGLILKLSGRIGQVATYGAGCWAYQNAEKSVATCTTGNGEYIMKTLLAKEIVDSLMSAECSITSLNNTFKTKFLESPFLQNCEELYGGALSLVYDTTSGDGEVMWSHTTQSLCLAYKSTVQSKPKFIFSTMPDYSKPGKSTVINAHRFKLPI